MPVILLQLFWMCKLYHCIIDVIICLDSVDAPVILLQLFSVCKFISVSLLSSFMQSALIYCRQHESHDLLKNFFERARGQCHVTSKIFACKMHTAPTRLKPRTSDLACTFPGTVPTWSIKIFSRSYCYTVWLAIASSLLSVCLSVCL